MSILSSTTPPPPPITMIEQVELQEEEEDVLPSFDLVELDDDPVNSSSALRAARILKARQAATNYKAKIEEPGWYFEAKPTTKGSPRPEMFSIHQLYLQRDYSEALRKGLACFKKLARNGAEFVEILDLVMRSSLKSEEEVTLEVIEVARKYFTVRKSHPGLCYSVALVLSSAPPSLNVSKLEALEASLSAASRPSLPHLILVIKLLKETENAFLATFLEKPTYNRWEGVKEEEVEVAIVNAGSSEDGAERLRKLVGTPGQKEEEEEVMRDARSL